MAKAKNQNLPALSDMQLEIMQVAWSVGEVTVTDVWNVLAKRRTIVRNTILTLMDRLAKKGWLERRVDGNTHHYKATSSRASTLGGVVHRLVEAAFAGSADELVLALLEGRGVSDEEADRIRHLIDNAKKRRSKS